MLWSLSFHILTNFPKMKDNHLNSVKFLMQFMPFCTFAGCGMVLAGNYLQWLLHSGRLTHPSLLVMIPPLIGVKGNLEMTFSSRISAIVNIQSDAGFGELFDLILSNFILSFLLAVIGGVVVATLALALSASATLTLSVAAQSFSVTICSASLASILIGLCMLLVIFLCKRLKIDPDNVAAPIAAALGDSMVLFIMTGNLWLIDSVSSSVISAHMGTILCLLVAFGPALQYLQAPRAESCLGANSTTLRCCLLPLCIAICLSSISGRLLASYVNELPNLARLQPVINGIGGNLASVLISRMTTRLSVASNPVISDGVSNCIRRVGFLFCPATDEEFEFKHRRSPSVTRRISEGSSDVFTESSFTLVEEDLAEALSHGSSAETTLVAVRLAISDSVLTGWNLLIACIPLHLILLVVNSALSHLFSSMGLVEPTAPVAAFTPAVILAHLSASFLQICVLLNFSRWLITHYWLYLAKSSTTADAAGRLASLDLMAISITTGFGDLLGTLLLTLALLVADA